MSKPTIRWGSLAWRLRSAMQDSGASLRDFERITGVDHATLSRLAADKPVKAEAMLAVCEVLEVDPMTLLVPAGSDEHAVTQ